jgi:hypothetical protein
MERNIGKLVKSNRENIFMCPITYYAPDKDRNGKPYIGVWNGRLLYSGDCNKTEYPIYTIGDTNWWVSLIKGDKMEYLNAIELWLVNREKPFYKYVNLVDGKLISTYSHINRHCIKGCKVITYTPNLIINAPKDSVGIFLLDKVYNNPKTAFNKSSGCYTRPLHVYQVKLLSPVHKVTRDELIDLGIYETCGVDHYVCKKIQLVKKVAEFKPYNTYV